jgi:adenosylmethionine-8-amino-7-oxononanoate aminotransferase
MTDNLWLHFARHGAGITPPIIARGEGVTIYDDRGKSYLDALSGLFTVQVAHGRTELAEADRIAEAIEFEGPATVAAVFLEPVQNAGGCIPRPPGYFERMREICDEYVYCRAAHLAPATPRSAVSWRAARCRFGRESV